MSKSFQLSLAPEKLWQAINPWTFYQQGAQFGFINIDLGQTPHPEVEQAVLDYVGSYGRQLGRIGDALEVLLNHVKLVGLSQAEKDALAVLQGQLAAVRQVKERTRTSASDAA
jgi:hypothetical protein